MTDRPTPEQIMEHNWPYSWTQQLERLAVHGYVIIHPDDAIPVNRIHLDIDSNRTFAHVVAAEQEPNPPFRIAVLHPDETWSYTDGEPIDIANAEQEVSS